MAPMSPTARLADHLIEGGLEGFVRTRRANGQSWRRIALELAYATDRQIEVSHEVIRRWYPDAGADA